MKQIRANCTDIINDKEQKFRPLKPTQKFRDDHAQGRCCQHAKKNESINNEMHCCFHYIYKVLRYRLVKA